MSWFGRAKTPPPMPAPSVAAKAAQGKALLLIGFNDATKQWEVGAEAVAVLERLRGPICTVSVCGRARQGKSFLLNQLLSSFTGVSIQKPSGFTVSPTHQSCTRGIWIWSSPIPAKTANGQPCQLVLMDCEGVDAVDQGQKHSAQVFCLAVLLSSVFVYNQLGAIDSVAIERLAMVCELAKRIKSSARGQADFHPAFIWLLRDFQLLLQEGNQKLTPLEYLEHTLNHIAGSEADVASKNEMRHTIKEVFQNREAWTLVRPALEEGQLQRLDTLQASELRPEFRTGMSGLVKLLSSKLQPLAVNGSTISGAVYTGLLARYVEAVNSGAVPELVSAWQGVSRAECQRALSAGVKVLGEKFKEDPGMEEGALYEMYKVALEAALKAYHETAMGDTALVSEYEAKLRADAQGRYENAKRQLAVVGERLAGSILEESARELQQLMAHPGVSLDQVEAALRRSLAEYERKVPGGPYKYKKASEFMMNTCIIGIKQHVAGILAAKEAAEKKVAALQAQLSQANQQAADVANLQQQLAAAREQVTTKAAEAARLEGELTSKSRALAAAEAKSAEGNSALTAAAGREQQLSARVAELQAAQAAAAEVQQQVEGLRQQLAAGGVEYKKLQQKEAAAQHEVAQLKAEAAAGRQQLAALQQQLSGLTTLQQQVAALQRQLGEVNAALAAKDADLAQYRVGGQRVEGERDAERELATRNLARLNEAETNLLKERTAHDATREQLRAAQVQLAQLRSASAVTSPAGSAGGAAAAGGSGPSTGRRLAPSSSRGKRGANAMEVDAPAADGGDDGNHVTPAAAGRTAKKQRQEAAPAESPVSPFREAAPAPGPVDQDINPDKMTINELKAWVTDNRVEDDQFIKLIQNKGTKKPDWVAYVKKKLEAARG